jgi:5-methylthioadenosine/S-adenosylhomocysteine deaminase
MSASPSPDATGTTPCDLLVTAAGVVTVDPSDTILRPGAIAVSGEQIVAVDRPEQLARTYAPKKRIDAPACWIFPGLVNTHNHLWQTMLKGLGDDMGLIDWIQTLLVPTMPQIDDECAYLGSALGALESARSGCTTMLDFMHHFPRRSLYDETIRAWEEIGGSLIMARTIRDSVSTSAVSSYERDLTLDEQLAHVESLLERYGRDRVWIAPGTVWGMSIDGLKRVRQLADQKDILITIHMNEVPFDSEESVRRNGMRSVPLLDSIGFLKDDVLHAHGVWNDDADIALLANRRCAVSYNPISNMYLGSGIPPILKMREAGVRLSLATDGAASNNSQDMIEALKFGALLQKVAHADSTAMTAPEILRMATVGGADAIHRKDVGYLAAGMRADFFLFDPRSPKSTPLHDPISTLVYTGSEHNVVTTVAAGRVVLEDGKITGLDEANLLAQAQAAADRLAVRAGIRQG